MKLPAFTYGLTRDVKRRSSRIITRLARQMPWDEAVADTGSDEMLDTDETEGLVVFDGPSPLLGSEPHFHLYLPLIMTFDAMSPRRGRLSSVREDEFFAGFIRQGWSALALQGQANQMWTLRPDRFEPFLSATVRFWPDFPDEPRYTIGSNSGSWLWDSVPLVRSVLGRMGVPLEALQPTIHTRDQLAALITAHDVRLDCDAFS